MNGQLNVSIFKCIDIQKYGQVKSVFTGRVCLRQSVWTFKYMDISMNGQLNVSTFKCMDIQKYGQVKSVFTGRVCLRQVL